MIQENFLLESAANGDLESVAYLVRRGVREPLALCCAAENGQVDVVRYLAYDADQDTRDRALVAAVEGDHYEVARVLIERGVSPEALDKARRWATYWAGL